MRQHSRFQVRILENYMSCVTLSTGIDLVVGTSGLWFTGCSRNQVTRHTGNVGSKLPYMYSKHHRSQQVRTFMEPWHGNILNIPKLARYLIGVWFLNWACGYVMFESTVPGLGLCVCRPAPFEVFGLDFYYFMWGSFVPQWYWISASRWNRTSWSRSKRPDRQSLWRCS